MRSLQQQQWRECHGLPLVAACSAPSGRRPWVAPSLGTSLAVAPAAAAAKARAADHSRRAVTVASGRSSGVVFFVDSEAAEGFKLPLEPQQLLGMPANELCKDSMVNKTHDDLLKVPLEPGYSQGLAAGRAEVLALARSSVLASKGRPADKRARDINIPYDLLPACLALLAELNENDLVLHLGNALLGTGELDSYQAVKSDVLLSMALAKCNLARDAFATSKQVAVGCRLLEEALQLLQPKGSPVIAPELAREVRSSLAELNSQCALEQVAAPLTKERAEERKRAVRTVREMLRLTGVDRVGSSSSTASTLGPAAPVVVNKEFVSRLMAQLTCDEVVHLHEWEVIAKHASSYKWVYPGLLERVAAGHVLLGFQQCAPAYVRMALQLIKHLPARSSEVLVMQAMCQLLLGSVHVAIELLQQAETLALRAPKGTTIEGGLTGDLVAPNPMWGAQAYAYVRDHTPAGDDGLLPGLCLYAQLWLAKVAAPQFRDTTAVPPAVSLSRYFDNTRVEALITVYDEKGEVGRGAGGGGGMGGAPGRLQEVAGPLGEQLQGVLEGLRGGLEQLREAARSTLAGEEAASGTPSSGTGGGSLDRQLRGAKALVGSVLSSVQATTVEQLGQRSKEQLAASAAVALGVVGLALMLWPRRAAPPLQAAGATSTATVVATRGGKQQQQAASSVLAEPAAPQLQTRAVEQLLKAWQDVKAQALGPAYESGPLADVLAEPVLADMRQKVAKFRAEGWYMRYKLHRLKIKEIDQQLVSQGRAVVRATLDESAALYDVDGRQADSYKSTYDAEYELVQSKDGVWRVAQVVVVSHDDNL